MKRVKEGRERKGRVKGVEASRKITILSVNMYLAAQQQPRRQKSKLQAL